MTDDKVSKNIKNSELPKNAFNKEILPPGMNWREWKAKKKEEFQKKLEFKMARKQAKLEKKEKAKQKLEEENKKKHDIRWYTVSIAVSGSIMDNVQKPTLKAHLAAKIARSAAIFRVNEIVVFSDSPLEKYEDTGDNINLYQKHHGTLHMARILQYLECPPYLRKYFFPIHKDLEHAGEVCPLQIPSHLGKNDESKYREGVVMNKPVKGGRGSFIYIGFQKPAQIDRLLKENVRVTVQLDKEQPSTKRYKGKAVSPNTPLKNDFIYWGYNVRVAKSFNEVFSECPYPLGYDLTIGTSDKGQNVDHVKLPQFNHLLIVFGGLKGIEACLEDESVEANDPTELFDYYLNVSPLQGTKTIRTEEAIEITLATLRPQIYQVQGVTADVKHQDLSS